MATAIEFRNKKVRQLSLNIAVDIKFDEVLNTINDVHFQGLSAKDEHIHFAILEMVNNSLRAQRETARTEPIRLEYECLDAGLRFLVADAGGGFDPWQLPYDLTQPVDALDTNGPAFQSYRELHEFQRFGLGLYTVKKVFPNLTITFLDEQKNPRPWAEGQIYGTRIEGWLENNHV